MKNKKLNLNELKVKSFVTDLEAGKENTVRGGGGSNECSPGAPSTGCNSLLLTGCITDNLECEVE